MKKLLAYIGLLISVTIWSLTINAIIYCLDYITAFEVTVIRFSVSSIFLWVIYLFRGKKMAFAKGDQLKIAIAGILGTAVYYYFISESLTHLSPAIVGGVTGVIPVLTLIIAMLFFNKKMRFRNIIFIGMSFVGIIILNKPLEAELSHSYLGISLMLVGLVGWVVYTLLNEPLLHKYDPLNILILEMFYGAVVLLAYYFYQIGTDQIILLNFVALSDNTLLVVCLVFISLFASSIAYYLYNFAIKEVGVIISALFMNVIPVVTLIVSVAFAFEKLTFSKIIACILIVLAVYLIDEI